MAGLCRSIDATMQELRSIAEERLSAQSAEDGALPLINPNNDADPQSRAEVMDAIDALIQLANEFPTGTAFQAPPDSETRVEFTPVKKQR